MRAAALQGLQRHVSYGFQQIQGQDKATLTAAMTKLLDSSPPAGRSPAAHAYLQRFAVDILDTLRGKQDKSLGVKLISMSTEPSNPNLIALYSASRIGAMGADSKGEVNAPEKVLESWSQRVLDAFEGEIERLKSLERPKKARVQPTKPESFLQKKTAAQARTQMGRGGGMNEDAYMEMEMGMESYEDEMGMDMGMESYEGMMDMGMMGRMGQAPAAKPQPPEVSVSRRQLNYVLQQLHLGVSGNPAAGMPTRSPGGLLASVADDKKPVVEAWITAMEPIVIALNEEQLDDREKYLEGLEAQVVVLREMLGIEEEEAIPGVPAAMAAFENELGCSTSWPRRTNWHPPTS